MKVCLVVSKSRLWEHILLFNSWPSRCPSCPSSPPSFNHTTFRTRRTFKWQKFFFPFQYKLRKENQVKLQKIDFQREHIFQVFGQLALRLFSCRARRPPKLHSLKIRDPVVKKSPLLTLVEGTGVDDIWATWRSLVRSKHCTTTFFVVWLTCTWFSHQEPPSINRHSLVYRSVRRFIGGISRRRFLSCRFIGRSERRFMGGVSYTQSLGVPVSVYRSGRRFVGGVSWACRFIGVFSWRRVHVRQGPVWDGLISMVSEYNLSSWSRRLYTSVNVPPFIPSQQHIAVRTGFSTNVTTVKRSQKLIWHDEFFYSLELYSNTVSDTSVSCPAPKLTHQK